jgi:hypothetical protein
VLRFASPHQSGITGAISGMIGKISRMIGAMVGRRDGL